jgi:hypothetical protein
MEGCPPRDEDDSFYCEKACIGILGEYIGRIYKQLQPRPLFVVRQTSELKQPCMKNLSRDEKIKTAIAALTLAAAVWLLFWNLGHYSLWDDECATALGAKGVLRTGDTSAEVGAGNILAFTNGLELIGTRIRSHPPLPYYITAGSFALCGVNPWAARVPFALCGLAAAALMLWWARRAGLRFYIRLVR